MIVKVCGMREAENITSVASLGIDMMGFIFYEKSARYVGEAAPSSPDGLSRVGVFVNSSFDHIMQQVATSSLDVVQLHGSESAKLCQELKEQGIKVIKALSISNSEDIELSEKYHDRVDYLLFDTKCSGHGGSGKRFDWSLLDHYQGTTPFLLSGGIDKTMAREIRSITHSALVGVDLNSRFEVSPAIKDIERLREFITELKR